jgi:hypothetical protein
MSALNNFDFGAAMKAAAKQQADKYAGLSEKEIEKLKLKERKEAAMAAKEKQAYARIVCFKEANIPLEVLRAAMNKQARVAAAAVGRAKRIAGRVKAKAGLKAKPKKEESKKAVGVMPWRKGGIIFWEDEAKWLIVEEKFRTLKVFGIRDINHLSKDSRQAARAAPLSNESVASASKAAKGKRREAAEEGRHKRRREDEDKDEEEDSVEKRCKLTIDYEQADYEEAPAPQTRPRRDRSGRLINYAEKDQEELTGALAATSISGRAASKDTTMEQSSEDNRDAPASPDSESSTSSQFSASISSTSSSSTSSPSSSASSQSSAPPIVFATRQEQSDEINDLVDSATPVGSMHTMVASLPNIPTSNTPRAPYQRPQIPTIPLCATLPPPKKPFFEQKNRLSKWWRKIKGGKYKPLESNKQSVYTQRPVKQAPPACELFAQNSAVALKAVREKAGSSCPSFLFAHVYKEHCELLDAIKEERGKGGMDWVYVEELPVFDEEFVWTPAQNAEAFKWTPPEDAGSFKFDFVKRRKFTTPSFCSS